MQMWYKQNTTVFLILGLNKLGVVLFFIFFNNILIVIQYAIIFEVSYLLCYLTDTSKNRYILWPTKHILYIKHQWFLSCGHNIYSIVLTFCLHCVAHSGDRQEVGGRGNDIQERVTRCGIQTGVACGEDCSLHGAAALPTATHCYPLLPTPPCDQTHTSLTQLLT